MTFQLSCLSAARAPAATTVGASASRMLVIDTARVRCAERASKGNPPRLSAEACRKSLLTKLAQLSCRCAARAAAATMVGASASLTLASPVLDQGAAAAQDVKTSLAIAGTSVASLQMARTTRMGAVAFPDKRTLAETAVAVPELDDNPPVRSSGRSSAAAKFQAQPQMQHLQRRWNADQSESYAFSQAKAMAARH
eukprot:CAMPEP_0180679574 /NCGR_PEP_ID=MMETSP1037_2-20121125/68998_1 /TAXON_ID=632150 /ORGANISM="Azadinium spinosum, Strain 3D9" /LENGTH=195 /DNA_ID=CAMNT_0022709313 /DNA_START=108 /DNA_END=696 /DNA_ORIENTATION=+